MLRTRIDALLRASLPAEAGFRRFAPLPVKPRCVPDLPQPAAVCSPQVVSTRKGPGDSRAFAVLARAGSVAPHVLPHLLPQGRIHDCPGQSAGDGVANLFDDLLLGAAEGVALRETLCGGQFVRL